MTISDSPVEIIYPPKIVTAVPEYSSSKTSITLKKGN